MKSKNHLYYLNSSDNIWCKGSHICYLRFRVVTEVEQQKYHICEGIITQKPSLRMVYLALNTAKDCDNYTIWAWLQLSSFSARSQRTWGSVRALSLTETEAKMFWLYNTKIGYATIFYKQWSSDEIFLLWNPDSLHYKSVLNIVSWLMLQIWSTSDEHVIWQMICQSVIWKQVCVFTYYHPHRNGHIFSPQAWFGVLCLEKWTDYIHEYLKG